MGKKFFGLKNKEMLYSNKKMSMLVTIAVSVITVLVLVSPGLISTVIIDTTEGSVTTGTSVLNEDNVTIGDMVFEDGVVNSPFKIESDYGYLEVCNYGSEDVGVIVNGSNDDATLKFITNDVSSIKFHNVSDEREFNLNHGSGCHSLYVYDDVVDSYPFLLKSGSLIINAVNDYHPVDTDYKFEVLGSATIEDVLCLEPCSNPAVSDEGCIYYDSDFNKLRLRNDTGWVNITVS